MNLTLHADGTSDLWVLDVRSTNRRLRIGPEIPCISFSLSPYSFWLGCPLPIVIKLHKQVFTQPLFRDTSVTAMADWAAIHKFRGALSGGISSAQVSSSSSTRFTRLLTGYFFMNLGSSVSRLFGKRSARSFTFLVSRWWLVYVGRERGRKCSRSCYADADPGRAEFHGAGPLGPASSVSRTLI
jgi:hypothetical protein